jgi:transposase
LRIKPLMLRRAIFAWWRENGAMARSAMTELQQQIEEVRREAFAAGYAAAMQAIRDLAARPAPGSAARSSRRGVARPLGTTTRSRTTAVPRRRAGAGEGTATRRKSATGRPERGANAQRVEEILKTSAPRALRIAEIRKALQEKGAEISFTSLRYALSQLEARSAVKQVGDTRTWRHAG